MFLIFGIHQDEKQLRFEQNIFCKCCGRFDRVDVWMSYACFMLFFFPLFKWNKRYYARTSCCSSSCEISPESGRAVETGKASSLNPDDLRFDCPNTGHSPVHRCGRCGYLTKEDFQFCPKCGKPF